MTHQEDKYNESMRQHLKRGQYYRFEPAVKAMGIPTNGPEVQGVIELEFGMGWYVGFLEGHHTFQGKPINDPRDITAPAQCQDAPNKEEIIEGLRECFFPVQFFEGTGVRATPTKPPRIASAVV